MISEMLLSYSSSRFSTYDRFKVLLVGLVSFLIGDGILQSCGHLYILDWRSMKEIEDLEMRIQVVLKKKHFFFCRGRIKRELIASYNPH